MTTIATDGKILALDVGGTRIGVATALATIQIASPLTTINNDAKIFDELAKLAREHQVTAIVIGLPRNLNGDDTAQTTLVRTFADQVHASLKLPVYLQDEALTSRQAEQELTERGKPYSRGEVDALAATYILEDYLQEQRNNV